ncbi:MAG: hypothetical protein ACPGFC_07670, partial [Paracoccaceae bacterium]
QTERPIMQTVTNVLDYDVSVDRLWAVAMDYSALAYCMRGKVRFSHLPDGRPYSGQVIDLRVSLLGVLPWQPYRIEMLEFSEEDRVMQSLEQGSGVQMWRHRATATETATGSRLTDVIDIEAGWKTPVVAAWARWMYQGRHKPRLELLASGQY